MDRWDDWSQRLVAFVSKPGNGFVIALALPILVVSAVASGPSQVLLLVVIYLIEAIAYVWLRRNR